MNERINEWMEWKNEWIDGRLNEWMDLNGWIDRSGISKEGWMGGWMDNEQKLCYHLHQVHYLPTEAISELILPCIICKTPEGKRNEACNVSTPVLVHGWHG